MSTEDTPGNVPLSDQLGLVEELAHRMCWRYKKSTDPHHSDTYTFNGHTLQAFADALVLAERKRLVAAERERCARICDEIAREMQAQHEGGWSVADHCASRIAGAA